MHLRRAYPDDEELLYEWRIRDEHAADWYEGGPVDREEHRVWFNDRVHNPAVDLFVASERQGGLLVGMCRVDSSGEISFSVVPEQRGKGFGARMIEEVCDEVPWRRVKASVDRTNSYGAKTLEAAGFVYRPDVDFYLLRK